jgi:LAO/AO transport system kinase
MVLDAMGKDIIFIETVGVGQDEVEIAEIAHTNIVVIIPGLGDGIQTIKAGILETATIFVVNKADQEGAERTVCDIQSLLLHHSPLPKEWGKLILKTQAHKNMGIDELATAIDSHWHFLTQYQLQKRKKDHLKKCFINALQDTLFKKAMTILHTSGYMDTILKELENDKTDPYDAAEKMVDKLLLPESGI